MGLVPPGRLQEPGHQPLKQACCRREPDQRRQKIPDSLLQLLIVSQLLIDQTQPANYPSMLHHMLLIKNVQASQL